jgi:steroid delta-isomerase-like uncharacterized protein
MGAKENEALIRKIYDEYNKGNHDAFDDSFSDDFKVIRHDGNILDKPTYKQFLTNVTTRYPDMHRVIQDLIVTEDRAALYYSWTGTDSVGTAERPASGKKLEVKELYFIRFTDGKISEYRQYSDAYGMMVQLGVLVPATQQ